MPAAGGDGNEADLARWLVRGQFFVRKKAIKRKKSSFLIENDNLSCKCPRNPIRINLQKSNNPCTSFVESIGNFKKSLTLWVEIPSDSVATQVHFLGIGHRKRRRGLSIFQKVAFGGYHPCLVP